LRALKADRAVLIRVVAIYVAVAVSIDADG